MNKKNKFNPFGKNQPKPKIDHAYLIYLLTKGQTYEDIFGDQEF